MGKLLGCVMFYVMGVVCYEYCSVGEVVGYEATSGYWRDAYVVGYAWAGRL